MNMKMKPIVVFIVSTISAVSVVTTVSSPVDSLCSLYNLCNLHSLYNLKNYGICSFLIAIAIFLIFKRRILVTSIHPRMIDRSFVEVGPRQKMIQLSIADCRFRCTSGFYMRSKNMTWRITAISSSLWCAILTRSFGN